MAVTGGLLFLDNPSCKLLKSISFMASLAFLCALAVRSRIFFVPFLVFALCLRALAPLRLLGLPNSNNNFITHRPAQGDTHRHIPRAKPVR